MKLSKIGIVLGIGLIISITFIAVALAGNNDSLELAQRYKFAVAEKKPSSALELPAHNDLKLKPVEPPIPKMVDLKSKGDMGITSYNRSTTQTTHSMPGNGIMQDEGSEMRMGYQGINVNNLVVGKISKIYQSLMNSFSILTV